MTRIPSPFLHDVASPFVSPARQRTPAVHLPVTSTYSTVSSNKHTTPARQQYPYDVRARTLGPPMTAPPALDPTAHHHVLQNQMLQEALYRERLWRAEAEGRCDMAMGYARIIQFVALTTRSHPLPVTVRVTSPSPSDDSSEAPRDVAQRIYREAARQARCEIQTRRVVTGPVGPHRPVVAPPSGLDLSIQQASDRVRHLQQTTGTLERSLFSASMGYRVMSPIVHL